MPLPGLSELAIAAGVGGMIGGLTNQLAIAMLFHPYRPLTVLGLRVPFTPGLIPKRQEDIARRIAEAVSTHLITPEVLARALQNNDLERAIGDRVETSLDAWLEEPLAKSVPAALDEEWDVLFGRLGDALGDWAAEGARSPEFLAAVDRATDTWLARLGEERIDQLLGEEGMAAAAGLARTLLSEWLLSPRVREGILLLVEERAERMLTEDRPLRDVVGDDAYRSFRDRAARRAVGVLTDRMPDLVERYGDRIADLLHRLLERDGSVLAAVGQALMRTETGMDTLRRSLQELAGVLSHDLQARKALTESIAALLEDVGHRPLRHLLGEVAASDYLSLKVGLENLLFDSVLTERNLERAAGLAGPLLQERLHQRLGDLLAGTPTADAESLQDRLRQGVREALSSPGTTTGIARQLRRSLAGPLGKLRPGRCLSPESRAWLGRTVTRNLLDLMDQHAGGILAHIDIRGIVEARIREFPMPKLEQIIRDCATRELRMITLLGFLLGAMVGILNPLLQALAGS